jgi:hypothetical protein
MRPSGCWGDDRPTALLGGPGRPALPGVWSIRGTVCIISFLIRVNSWNSPYHQFSEIQGRISRMAEICHVYINENIV